MKRIVLNLIVGLLSFVIGTAITSFFIKSISSEKVELKVIRSDVPLKVSCEHSQVNSSESIPGDWKKVSPNDFSFYLPRDMKDQRVKGIDSAVWEYRNHEMSLDIDYGMYDGAIDSYSNNPNYKIEKTQIDGKEAHIAIWDNSDTHSNYINTYSAAVHFPNVDGDTKLTFWVSSYYKAKQEDAKKIFRSIQFKR